MKLDYYTNRILLGDCKKVMFFFPRESVDLVVTDPPYGIGFMGKNWDKALPEKRAFEQMFRVLKSGGLAFVMSSPRQDVLWRMLKMLEEVGFELRQSFVAWIYKSGFPKAYDVSKGIDKKLGLERKREPITCRKFEDITGGKFNRKNGKTESTKVLYKTYPASELSKKWQGWKSITGLKPALECILMVNKPLSEKTIVDNVLVHGTGAINVNATRIPFENKEDRKIYGQPQEGTSKTATYGWAKSNKLVKRGGGNPIGRFPANLLVSDRAIEASKYFDLNKWSEHHGFLDVPKASKREREEGLESLPERDNLQGLDTRGRTLVREDGTETLVKRWKAKSRNVHPTVKPVKLMAYLIELGCPPNGIVLDPYVGSGTTCIASKLLGRKYIGIEIDPEYVEIAKARLRAT